MKELSIEEKAERYNEALERARKLQENSKGMILKKWLWNIFPELKESEDERIRKWLIGYFNQYIIDGMPQVFGNGLNVKDVISWLEKQGEQKPANSYCQENCKGFQETGKCFADGDCKAKREAESNDKNEPKFHEGDWVIYNNDICQIVKREEGCNILVTQFGVEKEPVNERNLSTAKLWDISDARDGDVLFHSDSASNGIFIFKEIIDKGFAKEVICYCDYDSEDHFCLGEHHTCCWTDAKILYPATKEQRDTLFAKMKEAGYIFDFKNKEFKKIETEIEIPFGAKDSELQEATYYIPKGFYAEIDNDKVVIKKGEKPTAWSEEDERNMQNIDSVLFYDKTLPEDTCVKLRNFLKTLKQRIGG